LKKIISGRGDGGNEEVRLSERRSDVDRKYTSTSTAAQDIALMMGYSCLSAVKTFNPCRQ